MRPPLEIWSRSPCFGRGPPLQGDYVRRVVPRPAPTRGRGTSMYRSGSTPTQRRPSRALGSVLLVANAGETEHASVAKRPRPDVGRSPARWAPSVRTRRGDQRAVAIGVEIMTLAKDVDGLGRPLAACSEQRVARGQGPTQAAAAPHRSEAAHEPPKRRRPLPKPMLLSSQRRPPSDGEASLRPCSRRLRWHTGQPNRKSDA